MYECWCTLCLCIYHCSFMCAFCCCSSKPCCSFKADREQSFSPLRANFLISTKRHLNHLSVSYRSSRARRQAGQQNKQPTLLHLTYLRINGQKQQGEAITRLLNLHCSCQQTSQSTFKTPKWYCICGGLAQPSVNKHFHAQHWVYNMVSGSYNECREAERAISQPSPHRDGGPLPHTQTTNHHGTVIDVSSCFEIYHPDQVAVRSWPDRLLNIA